MNGGPRGWNLWRSVPLPNGDGSVEGLCSLPRNVFEFLSRNGAFLCILLMTGGMPTVPLDPPLVVVAMVVLVQCDVHVYDCSLRRRSIPERFRGELLTMGRYTNLSLPSTVHTWYTLQY